jgi:hypothetical protein
MTLSSATRKKLHQVDDNQGVLVLLEMDYTSFTSPIYVASDTRNHTIGGVVYVGIPFSCTLPDDKAGEVPRAKLVLDNVGRDMTATLESLPPGAALTATLKVVHRATPEVVDYQFVAPMSGVRVTMNTMSATMGPDDLMRRPAVLRRFDPTTTPSLFPD